MGAMAVIEANGDDEDEFKYNYDNPLDSSHFVPNMNDPLADDKAFDFNLNGYDLIDIDQSKKLNVIQVEFATKANKENVEKNSNRNINNELMDIDDMNNENKQVTFQQALDSLPCNISSSISVHMCFICLLHLANEKELQFVPKICDEDDDKNMILERGNFEIQYASTQSQFEKDAQKINPVMVLGMQ